MGLGRGKLSSLVVQCKRHSAEVGMWDKNPQPTYQFSYGVNYLKWSQ